MATLQTFRHYRISQDLGGGTVELWRGAKEFACLAVDAQRLSFVELHVIMSPPEKPLDVRAFNQLVKIALPLRHRNLLGIMEGGEDDGAHFFVTEFLDGERFDTWLPRCNPLPPWLALHLLGQMVEGLCVLAPHPRLLGGVELLNCGVTLNGDRLSDLTVRLCDLGLSAAQGRQPDPRQIELRMIQETGRLLLYMLTGVMAQGPVESVDFSALSLPPRLSFLLGTLLIPSMRHHPLTLDQLRTLVERCTRDLSPELASRSERVPVEMRPRLPLEAHFMAGAGLVDLAGDECTIDAKPFDALDPYRHRATQRSTRAPAVIQLLPPARLVPLDYAKYIVQAGERIRPQEHPHLIRVLAWDELEHPEVLMEEHTGEWSLDSLIHVKGKLSAADTAVVLEQLEAAVREAEHCGLHPVLRSPRQIALQFTAPGGEEALPPEVELGHQPLESWPVFRIRVRTYPTTLNFAQPERFNAERLIHREPGKVEHSSAARSGNPWSTAPTSRDYALLAAWMMGGPNEVPERVRPLIYDHLSNRSEASLGGRREFLEQFLARAKVPSGNTGIVPVSKPRGQTRPVPPAASAAGASAPMELGAEAMATDPDLPEEPPVGFAEALFGGAKARTASLPISIFGPPVELEEETEERSFLDGPLPGVHDRPGNDYDADYDEPPATNRLLLWVFVIGLAALLAGVAAHFSGTAFWRR